MLPKSREYAQLSRRHATVTWLSPVLAIIRRHETNPQHLSLMSVHRLSSQGLSIYTLIEIRINYTRKRLLNQHLICAQSIIAHSEGSTLTDVQIRTQNKKRQQVVKIATQQATSSDS